MDRPSEAPKLKNTDTSNIPIKGAHGRRLVEDMGCPYPWCASADLYRAGSAAYVSRESPYWRGRREFATNRRQHLKECLHAVYGKK